MLGGKGRWIAVVWMAALVSAPLMTTSAAADPTGCQRAIARAAAAFARVELAAAAGCARDRLAGKLVPDTDCATAPDVHAARAAAVDPTIVSCTR